MTPYRRAWCLALIGSSMAFAAPPAFTLSGQVTTPTGKLAPGVKVQLVRVGEVMGMPMPAGSKEQNTDETGRFSFSDLPRGNYYLLAERHDAIAFWRAEQNLQLEKSTLAPLVLRAYSSVEVIVGDEKDLPQEGVHLKLSGAGSAFAISDAKGLARFDKPLPLGSYTLKLTPKGKRLAPMERELELTAPDVKMAIQLQPFALLTGRFVDEQGKTALGVAYQLDGVFYATSADGSFEVPVADPEHRHLLRFGSDAYQGLWLELAPGTAPKVLGELKVPHALPLEVAVTGPDGKPASHVRVDTHLNCDGPPCAPEPRYTETGADGIAHVGSYDGRWGELTLSGDLFELKQQRFEKNARRIAVKLEAKKPPPPKDIPFKLTVTDAKGKPVLAAVTLDGEMKTTDSAGVFATTTSKGTHMLGVSGGRPGYWTQQLVNLPAGDLEVIFPSDTHTLKIKAPWAIFAAVTAQPMISAAMAERWAKTRLPTSFMGQDGYLTAAPDQGTFSFSPSGVGKHTVVLVDKNEKPHVKSFTVPDADFEIAFDP